MKHAAVIAIVALFALAAATANAYEFKFLNGMELRGNLVSFNNGKFSVETELGVLDIDAGELDYIVIEENDPGSYGHASKELPGLNIKQALYAEVLSDAGTPVQAPAPLMGHSVPPAPLQGHSVGAASGGTGTFRGGMNK